MSNKTESLVRDIAALFVKYRLADWAPILEQLDRRGGSSEISAAIQRHLEEARRAPAPSRAVSGRAAARRSPKASAPQLDIEPRFRGPHADTIEELRQALVTKRVLASLPRLRSTHAALGLKLAGAGKRDSLITSLTEHLDRLEEASFQKALHVVARFGEDTASGAVADYDRWFKLITTGRTSAP